jgi:uncharacterized lipoprotein YbaY
MKSRYLTILFTILLSVFAVSAQTSWLDRPLNRNWNTGDGNIPAPPRTTAPMDPRCREMARTPDSLADRALTRAGWILTGPSQSFGTTSVMMAMAAADGQCRPDQYNGFVFVSNRFAGTLAPRPMSPRTDGSLSRVLLYSATSVSAEFARYSASDALCCPSQTSMVTYSITTGGRPIVNPETVNTAAACPGGTETPPNAVTGTVTYRRPVPLPPTAVISVRLLDASREDIASAVIAEDRISAEGKQVPIAYDLAYDPNKIQQRNRYVVRAEIRDGERLLFTTDTSYPVITQGNPTTGVEVVVVPVGGGGGGGGGGGTRESSIRGTVTYQQRIALPPNSQIRVWLVDSADPNGTPVSENTFSSGNRQVPIPYTLEYANRDVNRQRNYEMRAEIRSGGQITFRSVTGTPVTLRGNRSDNVEILVVPYTEAAVPITGQSFNMQKFGAGTMTIEGRGPSILVGGRVLVRENGDADVSLVRVGGTIVFSGKLVVLDPNTMRISVQNSGDADASGEIIIGYTGQRLNSITSQNLKLDGQNVTIRF